MKKNLTLNRQFKFTLRVICSKVLILAMKLCAVGVPCQSTVANRALPFASCVLTDI